MAQQIVFIHGGTTFSDYDAFIEYLKSKPMQIERLLSKQMWFNTLNERLGDDFQVLAPSMPNKTNAKYNEWSLWFSRVAEVVDDGVILIGHSLGGIFLPKYLSENEFPKKIKAVILVAAPYDDEAGEDLTDFKITGSLEGFSAQAPRIIFFHGSDDPVVPRAELDKYLGQLSDAELHILSAPDHFMREEFGELVEAIKAI